MDYLTSVSQYQQMLRTVQLNRSMFRCLYCTVLGFVRSRLSPLSPWPSQLYRIEGLHPPGYFPWSGTPQKRHCIPHGSRLKKTTNSGSGTSACYLTAAFACAFPAVADGSMHCVGPSVSSTLRLCVQDWAICEQAEIRRPAHRIC